MKERPILFSAPMINALLAGTKTQTRRAMKPQPEDSLHAILKRFPNQKGCPYGDTGDALWVRETWKADCVWDDHSPKQIPQVAAGEPNPVLYLADESATGIVAFDWGRVRQSIFMPRWASRITLRITGVQVERLNDISEADAVAEGVEEWSITQKEIDDLQISDSHPDEKELARLLGPGTMPAKAMYQMLWHEINGKGSWESNPFVWVVSFERIPQPEASCEK